MPVHFPFRVVINKFLKCLAILGLFTFLIAESNAEQIDSLAFLKKIREVKELQFTKLDSALSEAFKLRQNAIYKKYEKGVALAENRIGSIYSDQGNYDSADYFFRLALNKRRSMNDERGVVSSFVSLGHIGKAKGNLDSANYYFIEAARLGEKVRDSTNLIYAYLELAHLYTAEGEVEKAIAHYNKALNYSKALLDKKQIVNSFDGLANFYYTTNQLDSALHFYNLVLEYTNSKVETARTFNNIASCFSTLNREPLAIDYYKKAKAIYAELAVPYDLATVHYNLGSSFYFIEQYDSSIQYFKNALFYYLESGNKVDVADCYASLSELYSLKKEYSKAYSYQLKYSDLKDSVLNTNKLSSIAEMQTKYETEKKEQQIVLLDEQNKTQKAEKNFLLAASAVLLLVLTALGVYFVQRNRIAKKNAMIAEQKIESLLDEQEIKTYNAMLEGQEEERMRIATDLHDRLGSMLSTVKLLFSALDEKIDKAQEENKKQYEKANHLLDEACVEVRRISHNLGTGMVANFGLIRALEELCESIDQSGKIECNLLVHGVVEKELKLNVEVGIYRMVQEIFNNTMKHAKANTLSLQMNRLEQSINIMIEDDGVGFDFNSIKEKEGMGLSNLSKRAEKLGGSIHIDSQIGRGTTTIIELPLNLEA